MVRIGNKNLARRANSFSKKIEIWRQALAPYFLSQNFAASTRSDMVV
jgi:hypothetical protein